MKADQLPEWIRVKQGTKVVTKDVKGRENGFLIDILNCHDQIYRGREDERFQQVYYSSVYQRMFKGFHIHPAKYDTVTCIQGRALLVFYPDMIQCTEVDTIIDLDRLIIILMDTDSNIVTVSFPSKYPHGYYGISEIACVLNYRNPAWHPGDTFQYDYRCEGIETYLEKWVRQHESD